MAEPVSKHTHPSSTQAPARAPERKATGGRSLISLNCPTCGQPAKADLAPNPGLPQGGESAPHEPPPEAPGPGTIAHLGGMGQWFLVLCDNRHQTLWHEARLDELKGKFEPADLFR